MKQTILSILFSVAVIFSATAQVDINRPQYKAPVAGEAISQGNWLLGGEIGNIGMNFKSENFYLNLTPRAAYFIGDNAAVGVQGILGLSVYDGGEMWNYGATPFIRYYFPEGARDTGRFFGEFVIGIAGSSTEDSTEDAVLSRVWGFKGGYAHFVAQNVALEGVLSYVRSNADFETGLVNAGLSIGIGFNIYLPGTNNTITTIGE